MSMIQPVTQNTFSTIVVDDSTFQRTMVKTAFTKVFAENHYSYSIVEADDGNKGWEMCEKSTFNLYILDYDMPFLNGVVLSRKILEQNAEASIVLYSSEEKKDIEAKEGEVDPAVQFIKKDILVLKTHLKTLVEQWSENSA